MASAIEFVNYRLDGDIIMDPRERLRRASGMPSRPARPDQPSALRRLRARVGGDNHPTFKVMVFDADNNPAASFVLTDRARAIADAALLPYDGLEVILDAETGRLQFRRLSPEEAGSPMAEGQVSIVLYRPERVALPVDDDTLPAQFRRPTELTNVRSEDDRDARAWLKPLLEALHADDHFSQVVEHPPIMPEDDESEDQV